jgi:hypothetical protein
VSVRWTAVVWLVAAAGCQRPADEFFCATSAMCRQGVRTGTCEPDQRCSFPDAACPSMRRYAAYSGRLSETCVGADSIAGDGMVVLPATWFGQEMPSWAGPGAARIALSTRMSNPTSQQALATFMGTDASGTFDVGKVNGALNHFLNDIWFETKPMSDPPTAAQRELLKRDLLLNINTGHPLVANVVSGFRPPGYPPAPIYHYVTIIGYDLGGDRVLISDPGAEGAKGPGWETVPRTYWISLTDLGTWIGGKGYTA